MTESNSGIVLFLSGNINTQGAERLYTCISATRRIAPCTGPSSAAPTESSHVQTRCSNCSVHDRAITVLTDRVIPAFILNETQDGATTTMPSLPQPPPAVASPDTPPAAWTTCSGHHVRLPARFNTCAFSAGGGEECRNFPRCSQKQLYHTSRHRRCTSH